MKKFIFIALTATTLLYVLTIGVPFQVVAGKADLNPERVDFTASTKALAQLVTFAPDLTLKCVEHSVCVRCSDRQQKLSNIPIELEPCTAADSLALKSCTSGSLILHLTTAQWVLSSFVKL